MIAPLAKGSKIELSAVSFQLRDSNSLTHPLTVAQRQDLLHAYNSHNALVEALKTLTDHASETFPHFESERGQRDIKQAKDALALAGWR